MKKSSISLLFETSKSLYKNFFEINLLSIVNNYLTIWIYDYLGV